MERYLERIKKIADENFACFIKEGHAIAGCNGPYKNVDTPVRNTAHWCVTYAFLYRRYNDENYRSMVETFEAYLLNNEHYGVSGAIKSTDNGVDDTNGVIGQAWTIEGIIAAYEITKNEACLNRAIKIFKSQVFDWNKGIWKICCTDGRVIGYDYVYNHNLWFATSGAMILLHRDDKEIRESIERFLDCSRYTLGVQMSGVLFHVVNLNWSLRGRMKFFVKMLLTDINIGKFKKMNYLEKGYQLFDLYGFALLKNMFGQHPLFKTRKLKNAVSFGLSKGTIDKLGDRPENANRYAYAYNSPAFEFPYVSLSFLGKCDEDFAKKLLEIQDIITFDTEKMNYGNNNDDPETLMARIYELVRYYQGVSEYDM